MRTSPVSDHGTVDRRTVVDLWQHPCPRPGAYAEIECGSKRGGLAEKARKKQTETLPDQLAKRGKKRLETGGMRLIQKRQPNDYDRACVTAVESA